MKYLPTLALLLACFTATTVFSAEPFLPDASPVPRTQPTPAPADGIVVSVNPPSLIWKNDARAGSYTLEFSLQENFGAGVVRVADIPYAFYNHNAPFADGKWFWRYFVVRGDGARSQPSKTQSFIIAGQAQLPLPNGADLLAAMPGHPRVFATPTTLAEFRARRLGVGQMAYEQVRLEAEETMKLLPPKLALLPLPATFPPHRRQVFWLEEGVPFVPKNYSMLDLNRDADRANVLSFAYLISGEERYAQAAKLWALYVAHFRMDYHLKSVEERGQHDTVVYAYEKGVRSIALCFDRLQAQLSPSEKRALLDHVEFHGEAAMHWIRDVMHLQLDYQDSHGQQCMHMLLTTALAIAGDSKMADSWLTYMVPQYANRIPWMSEDGGYFEGQAYAFKLSYILEGLAALKTATGLDLFRKPEIMHAGDFFLYCQSLNFWFPHWGDDMGLWFPYGNVGDAFMSAMLAAMTNNRTLQWWSDAIPAASATPPFGYLAATGIKPAPPVSIAQGRAFVATGVAAAFDRQYDLQTTRLFFRSSPWGGESHAHADQNSFVIHRGGEILAADTGYYTYYGDDNYNQVATQTISHNSVLVDGKGQINDITGEGKITVFFESPRYAFMAGDASKAYGGAMDLFRRDLLFIRPGIFVVADELRAPQPAEFTWLLNTFAPPETRPEQKEIVVNEREQQLWVKQIFPEKISYSASDARLTPRKTKVWTRFTEAFPEPWKLKAVTERATQTDILTVMQAFAPKQTSHVVVSDSQRDEHGSAFQLKLPDATATVLLRRRIAESGVYESNDLKTDARVAVVERDGSGKILRWLVVEGRSLDSAQEKLFRAATPVSLSLEASAAARWQLSFFATAATSVTIALPEKPEAMEISQPEKLARSSKFAWTWEKGEATFAIPIGESVVFIDRAVPLESRPKQWDITLHANHDTETISFETGMAENGDWMAYAQVTPKTSGYYEFTSSDTSAEFLVQDDWDEDRTTRGVGKLRGLVGDQTQIIIRVHPTKTLPKIQAKLVEAVPLSRINLIRNGDCEAGLPGYPPRGWSVQNGCSSETYGTDGVQGWPGWSQEAAANGKASLKFIRPINVSVDWRAPFPVLARNQMVALAPPVRLLRSGKYLLSGSTKGTATTATIELETSAGVTHKIAILPTEQWHEQQMELDLPAGYTQVRVKFSEGGKDDQLLWADDLSLTPVLEEKPTVATNH